MGRIIYVTRSGVEDRQQCPRLSFLSTAYPIDGAPRGLQRRTAALPLLRGTTAHAAFARVLMGWDLTKTIETMKAEYRAEVELKGVHGIEQDQKERFITEQLHLMECVLRGWYRVRLPLILEEEDPVAIEQEWQWEMAPGVVEPMRFDYIGRRKDTGMLVVRDWKSASSISDDWAVKFEHDLQTNLYVLALAEFTGEVVDGITYEGLLVGSYKKETARNVPWSGEKIQQSPYCYGYMLPDSGGNGLHFMQSEYTAKKGWVKFRVPGVVDPAIWVDQLDSEDRLAGMFTTVPSLHPPPFEMDSIRRQVVSQELKWHEQLDHYYELLKDGADDEAERFLDLFAPQHTSRCVKFGADNRCAFYGTVCFTEGTSPLEDGMFEPRESHHNVEENVTL